MGQKNGRINGVSVLTRVFFYKNMYGGFCQTAKKSGGTTEVAVRKAGFHVVRFGDVE